MVVTQPSVYSLYQHSTYTVHSITVHTVLYTLTGGGQYTLHTHTHIYIIAEISNTPPQTELLLSSHKLCVSSQRTLCQPEKSQLIQLKELLRVTPRVQQKRWTKLRRHSARTPRGQATDSFHVIRERPHLTITLQSGRNM